MRVIRIVVFLAAAVMAAASLSYGSGRITGVRNLVNNVQRLTGPLLTQSPYDIGGTDLGIPIYYNNMMCFLFGDTFSGDTSTDGGNWRRNTAAWSLDTTPSNGITLGGFITNPSTGQAKQLFTNNVPLSVVTNIPTGGLSVNGYLYAWFMNVIQWGPASGEWYISQAELARWNDTTSSFDLVSNNTFPSNSNFGMVAAREGVNGDPYIYLWGTPAGRFGGVKLARFLPSQIENRSAYEFYDGSINGVPQWTSDEFAADIVVGATVGEMSVMYNPAIGGWTILYFNETNDKFQIRYSDTPWGPWSSPVTVMSSNQCPSGTSGLYAPYMHPQWVENNGSTIYFTYSLWVPYDVYLAKVTLNSDPAPSGSVTINGGAAYTTSTTVTLSLPGTDNSGAVYQMRISNDGVFDTEAWENYAASKTWTLASGDGAKTVYVRYRDSYLSESATYTDTIVLDTTPPAIGSVVVAPTQVAEGDVVHVTVNATDSNGVALVKAESTVNLTKTGSTTWECDILAGAIGAHSVRIDATDVAGNTSTYYSTGYVTLPVVAASAKSLVDTIMTSAATRYLFRVCGRVTIVNSNTFDLSDGTGFIHVSCPGYSGIANDDYATATGVLTPGGSPLLTVQPARVKKIGSTP